MDGSLETRMTGPDTRFLSAATMNLEMSLTSSWSKTMASTGRLFMMLMACGMSSAVLSVMLGSSIGANLMPRKQSSLSLLMSRTQYMQRYRRKRC